jgi:hypothetical protein
MKKTFLFITTLFAMNYLHAVEQKGIQKCFNKLPYGVRLKFKENPNFEELKAQLPPGQLKKFIKCIRKRKRCKPGERCPKVYRREKEEILPVPKLEPEEVEKKALKEEILPEAPKPEPEEVEKRAYTVEELTGEISTLNKAITGFSQEAKGLELPASDYISYKNAQKEVLLNSLDNALFKVASSSMSGGTKDNFTSVLNDLRNKLSIEIKPKELAVQQPLPTPTQPPQEQEPQPIEEEIEKRLAEEESIQKEIENVLQK